MRRGFVTQSNPGGRRQTGVPGETLRCGAPRAEPRVCALAPLREGEGARATRANALGNEHVALSREEDTTRPGWLSFLQQNWPLTQRNKTRTTVY